MLTDETCEKVYAFLTKMLKEGERGEVIIALEEEFTSSDAIASEDMPTDLDELIPRKKRKVPPPAQTLFSGFSSKPDLFSDHPSYSPQKRLHLLLDAIEYTVISPLEMGEYVMNSAHQDTITFGSADRGEVVVSFTRQEMQAYLPEAHILRTFLDMLRQQLGERE